MNKLVMSDNCVVCKKRIDEVEVKLKRIITDDTGRYDKYCSNCVSGTTAVKDVYYGYGSGVQTEENICDPKTGQPIPFSSKTGKWEAMKKAGVVEVGDRVHGARTTFTGR